MDILLRSATVVDPLSPFHLQQKDIFISGGVITSVADSYNGDLPETIVAVPDLCVSPGWIDSFANLCDPGFEFRETLESGAEAAAAGGFTNVFVLPHTNPVLQNKSSCAYVLQKSLHLPVSFQPIGAVTENTAGKELTEMYDMESSGAVAFSDGTNSIQSSGIMLKALQYVKAINKLIIQLPDDTSIHTHGLMNEGVVSTGLGLPGKPAIAEELMIARDLELLAYTGSRLHITGISTAKGVEAIRKAKHAGLSVTCAVTPFHLLFCDEDLSAYDTNLKVNPPLRTAADRQALQDAVIDGTVDCIATHHSPHNADHKVVEFEYAKEGMIGLQTCFAAVRKALPQLDASGLVAVLSSNTARIFGIAQNTVAEKSVASLSLFSMHMEWTFQPEDNLSRSKNSPFFGTTFTGKPLGIINKDKLFLNQL